MKWMSYLTVALALLATATPAVAQPRPPDWGDFFDEPLYLVRCEALMQGEPTGCPNDGMLLVPDATLYPRLTLRELGGPFRRRADVENARAQLVRMGMTDQSVRIDMVDRSGRVVNGFWLGSRPVCTDRSATGPLSGNVQAQFGAATGRPESMPVRGDALSGYIEIVNEMTPECREIAARHDPNLLGATFGTPPPVDGQVAAGQSGAETPMNFAWDRRVRFHVAQCFGARGAPRPDPCSEVETYYDHYFLNGQFVASDQRTYEQVRAQLRSRGQFWYERGIREEVTQR